MLCLARADHALPAPLSVHRSTIPLPLFLCRRPIGRGGVNSSAGPPAPQSHAGFPSQIFCRPASLDDLHAIGGSTLRTRSTGAPRRAAGPPTLDWVTVAIDRAIAALVEIRDLRADALVEAAAAAEPGPTAGGRIARQTDHDPSTAHAGAERGAYNMTDAAKALGISRTTLYRMINAGEIETFTIRGLQRVTVAEIERIVVGSSAG